MRPKAVADKIMAGFGNACRAAGIKVTPQRTGIFRSLAASDAHPSAEMVHAELAAIMPNVSLDTVYRAFRLFENLGLLKRVDSGLDCARYDADMGGHHHFTCVKCGAILDFQLESDALRLPPQVASLGEVESASLDVKGACTTCQKKNRN